MGEVWRAKDSKLGREVAIKTLPEEFAQDEERLARFEREAKLLASLNHPNIAAIYGLEEHNGSASGLACDVGPRSAELKRVVENLVHGKTHDRHAICDHFFRC